MRAQRLALCLSAASVSLLPAPLRAEEGRVDQVEGLEIEAETAELELQFVLAEEEDARLLIGTFEYGFSDWLQLGVEIESESEDGEALRVESIAPQAKIMFTDPGSAPVGLGLQAGAVIDTGGDGIGGEFAFIAEHRREDFTVIANLIAEAEPGDWSEGSLAYAARGDWELGETIGARVEFDLDRLRAVDLDAPLLLGAFAVRVR